MVWRRSDTGGSQKDRCGPRTSDFLSVPERAKKSRTQRHDQEMSCGKHSEGARDRGANRAPERQIQNVFIGDEAAPCDRFGFAQQPNGTDTGRTYKWTRSDGYR